MYLSICKKEFNDIKPGVLFDTYQETNYAFIREKGTEQKFQRLPFQEYSSYFTRFKDCVFLPTIHEKIVLIGLFNKREKNVLRYAEEFFRFEKLHFDELIQMQLSIFEPIEQLSKIEGFKNYSSDLYKELKQIEEFQKVGFLLREDIQEKIKKAEVIVKEIEVKIKKQLLEI